MLQLSFINYKKGSYLTVEGKVADRFFIIQAGQVRCERRDAMSGTGVDMLGPGDFVGVVSCMAGMSQIETSIAISDVVVIAVRRDQYPELIKQNTPIAMKMIRTFANRMRVVNEMLMFRAVAGGSNSSPLTLFNVATFYEHQKKTDIAAFAYYQYLKTGERGKYAEYAKRRFLELRKKTNAVYFEPTADMTRRYPEDTMIFCENQSGAEMFIIQSGQVKIGKVVDGKEVTFAILKKGDMFGEMALLENKPRSASAIANEDCVLMVVNSKNFNQMVTTQPQMIARLTTTLAERLWSMSRQLTNTQIADPITKMLDMIALQVEKAKLPQNFMRDYRTGLSLEDVADMCGLEGEEKMRQMYEFRKDSHIKLDPITQKIIVSDCDELIKHAAFTRSKLK
ncbi:MAG: cyclic nucleotide-binding domain-containing protein [Treponema sp.]|nr:cyclic nucleotide-binding domain-containing protein [Treponema sp.]